MNRRIAHIEIAGRDGHALEAFYGRLFGWTIRRERPGGHAYGRIETGGEPTAGIRHEPEGSPEIVFYVEVDDVRAETARAVELGADVRISPMETPDMTFALIRDPEGNPVGLVEPKAAGAGDRGDDP